MNFLTVVGAFVIIVPILVVLGILATMWKAWWLYPTWAWFIVPLGVPAISFWHFAALLFIVHALTAHPDTKKDERETQWAAYVGIFVWPVLAWLILRWMHGGS